MEGWDSFFLGHVGASAALGGLLFVAISLNLSRLLEIPILSDRALAALSLLLAILVVSSLMLIPGQPAVLLGLEVLAVTGALAALGLTTGRRRITGADPANRTKAKVDLALYAVAIMPYAAGALAMLMGGLRAGLYLVAASIILSFVKAVFDAWVLLIEINR